MTCGYQRTHLCNRQAGPGVADTPEGRVAIREDGDRATIRSALFRRVFLSDVAGMNNRVVFAVSQMFLLFLISRLCLSMIGHCISLSSQRRSLHGGAEQCLVAGAFDVGALPLPQKVPPSERDGRIVMREAASDLQCLRC
jgi:hypothetical protein